MTAISTLADEDLRTVRSVFDAFASHDLAALSTLFHSDATWHHRNNDRFGGRHRGSDGIAAYLAEAAQLTAGTLSPVPQSFMADGAGQVCVLVQVSGTRPDGRSFDDPQVAVFTVQDGLIRAVDQYVGDPAVVGAFWA
jgi:ketosteroid isomerase-like protein